MKFEPGKDYLTTVSENLCDLGTGMIKAVADSSGKPQIGVVELGGTPGNGLSAGRSKLPNKPVREPSRFRKGR